MYHKYKDEEQIVEFSGLKRKHKNLTKSDINNKVDYFWKSQSFLITKLPYRFIASLSNC